MTTENSDTLATRPGAGGTQASLARRTLPGAAAAHGAPYAVARLPDDEPERLAALAACGVLDTAPERDFDVLVKRLAHVCDLPIAMISLVDARRRWSKASFGVEDHETPRDVAICAHAILGEDIFEIPDATADPRFAGNPLVVGEPGIRYYVGVPLRTPEGHNIGTLCAIDRVPRRLGGVQRDALRQLGRDVMDQIVRRRNLHTPSLDRMLETVDRGSKPAVVGELPIAGARFGRYTILDEIGRGAMATVYTAYDEQLDRRVAIKLIHDRDTGVEREAQAVARVSHPNVVQIYEIGTFEGHPFIAMELVDGVTLGTWQRVRSRDIYEIIAKYAAAGRGLVAVHALGIVHRDFKPDNVLIDRDGRPRIGDFGLAHLRDTAGRREYATTLASSDELASHDDTIVGTPAYMAPEQLYSPDVDERADQFSLCASLYEAVYGVRPFRGATIQELRASVRAGALQEPLPGRTAPPTLLALLRRGLAIDPANRWRSLARLLDRLDELDARRDPAAAGRERRRVAIAVSVACIVVLGVPFMGGADAAAALSIGPMTAMSGTFTLAAIVSIYFTRDKLLGNDYHRRMIALILVLSVGYVVTPLLAVGAGLSVEQAIFIGDIAMGQCFLLAAGLIAPTFLLSCLVSWGGAVAIGFGAPVLQTFTISVVLTLLVFIVSWSYPPSTRPILSLIPGARPRRPAI